MFKKFLIVPVLMCVGCVTPPKVWVYPDFKIIKTDKGTVQDICYSSTGTFDDGRPQVKSEIRCCWKSKTKEFWINEWDPECLLHELCHQQGIARDICGRDYKWDK